MGGGRRGRGLLVVLALAGVTLLRPNAARAVDKPPPSGPTLTIDDVTVAEGNSGQKPAIFTVTLSPTSATPVSVHFTTTDGTATAPSDYVAQAGVLVFGPGDATKQIAVQVNGDTADEADET